MPVHAIVLLNKYIYSLLLSLLKQESKLPTTYNTISLLKYIICTLYFMTFSHCAISFEITVHFLKLISGPAKLFWTGPWIPFLPFSDCICPAHLTFWPVTLFLNRTSPNILPLCKVLFPGSNHPLTGSAKTAFYKDIGLCKRRPVLSRGGLVLKSYSCASPCAMPMARSQDLVSL